MGSNNRRGFIFISKFKLEAFKREKKGRFNEQVNQTLRRQALKIADQIVSGTNYIDLYNVQSACVAEKKVN